MSAASRRRTKPPAEYALRSALTTFLDRACKDAADAGIGDKTKGPRHPYVVHVNATAEQLVRAFRAVVREQVRQLPGRAQKGAVNAALRSVTPHIEKRLKV